MLWPHALRAVRSITHVSGPYKRALAEEVGFEPTKGLHHCRISSPVHSTALPLFLLGDPEAAALDSARGRAHLSTRTERVPRQLQRHKGNPNRARARYLLV